MHTKVQTLLASIYRDSVNKAFLNIILGEKCINSIETKGPYMYVHYFYGYRTLANRYFTLDLGYYFVVV